MALYDYQCLLCEDTFELNKKIAERDETSLDICPNCAGVGSLERKVGAPLIGYSVTTSGYGRGAGDGWKEVLKKVHSAPGAKKGFSSFI